VSEHKPTKQDLARDLLADLALSEASELPGGPWQAGTEFGVQEWRAINAFIAASREGWPAAIRIALAERERADVLEQCSGSLCEKCGWNGVRGDEACAFCQRDQLLAELAEVAAERNELLRLARRLVKAATEEEEAWAYRELHEYATGNGYLDIPEPVVAQTLRENRRMSEERDAMRALLREILEVNKRDGYVWLTDELEAAILQTIGGV
jgi:hypothetical protein